MLWLHAKEKKTRLEKVRKTDLKNEGVVRSGNNNELGKTGKERKASAEILRAKQGMFQSNPVR